MFFKKAKEPAVCEQALTTTLLTICNRIYVLDSEYSLFQALSRWGRSCARFFNRPYRLRAWIVNSEAGQRMLFVRER